MTDELRAQYEAYPYPARDPADEAKRLITGSPSHIVEIDHYVFGGRRDWSKPFRALIAGGGTGDGAIMLARSSLPTGAVRPSCCTSISARHRSRLPVRARRRAG
jgi:hypothetical protein